MLCRYAGCCPCHSVKGVFVVVYIAWFNQSILLASCLEFLLKLSFCLLVSAIVSHLSVLRLSFAVEAVVPIDFLFQSLIFIVVCVFLWLLSLSCQLFCSTCCWCLSLCHIICFTSFRSVLCSHQHLFPFFFLLSDIKNREVKRRL